MIFSSMSKREKIILAVACAAICASIFYNFVFDPFIKKWLTIDTRIVAKQVKLQKDIKILSRQQYIKKEYQNYAPLTKGSRSDDQHMADILSEIEGLGRKTNVYITVLKPQAIKETGLCKKFTAAVELDTTVKDLAAFFYEVGNSAKILKIDSAEIIAKPGQKDSIKAYLLISSILFEGDT